MATWRPDPSFYPSPRMAMQAPAEAAGLRRRVRPFARQPDALAVVDVDPASASYAQIVGQVGDAQRRRRAAPFRLERLQLLPLPERAAPACRAALPRRARACAPRASTSSTPSPIRRTRKIVKVIEPEEIAEQGRLQPAAHRPLRARAASMSARSATPRARRRAASS